MYFWLENSFKIIMWVQCNVRQKSLNTIHNSDSLLNLECSHNQRPISFGSIQMDKDGWQLLALENCSKSRKKYSALCNYLKQLSQRKHKWIQWNDSILWMSIVSSSIEKNRNLSKRNVRGWNTLHVPSNINITCWCFHWHSLKPSSSFWRLNWHHRLLPRLRTASYIYTQNTN